MIEAILTQRTNWKNVEKALQNCKIAGLQNLKGIYALGKKNLNRLQQTIKPCGFYKTKAEYLFGLAKFVFKNYGSAAKIKKAKTDKLRQELLTLKGVGEETADDILLYALDKPVFVIDEYTRRFVKQYKLSPHFNYGTLQKLFESSLKPDYRLYQDFHALIVIDGKKDEMKNLNII